MNPFLACSAREQTARMLGRLFWGLGIAACAVATVSGATITGTVRAQGKAAAVSNGVEGKYESRQFKFVERVDYAAMREFVVYIEGAVTNSLPALPRTAEVATRKIAQKGAVFSPHVLPVMAGTTVEWPNYDDILHNVFSFSETKPFDLGLYKAPEIKRVKFDRPGRVDVFCSIHTRMNCIILVLENPFFAATNDKGMYRIGDVPPGQYRLTAWHERLPRQTREITVPETGELRVDFVLGITGLPTPEAP